MPDDLHRLFNEAGAAISKLNEALNDKGYREFAERGQQAFFKIDEIHHDYAELILDPS